VGTDYWDPFVEYIIRCIAASGGSSPYGNGTQEGAGYCEVGEIWAYFLQSTLYKDRYGGSLPDFGTNYFFRPQILRYLYERGMTREEIFNALKPNVTSLDDLQDELLSLYPERESQIRQVFNRYAR